MAKLGRKTALPDVKGWLSMAEAAKRLNVTPRTVRRMAEAAEGEKPVLRSKTLDVERVWHEDVAGAELDTSPPE